MGVIAAQGTAFLIAGAAAELVSPAVVIAAGGGIGALATWGLTRSSRRLSPAGRRHQAPPSAPPAASWMCCGRVNNPGDAPVLVTKDIE
ncbi:MAG: hypothetical protein M3Z75_13795 [Actinomycetota bacterium]|jgi:hypothetical protein|nr:hypothetical protein [Actinomycetota bacterium]